MAHQLHSVNIVLHVAAGGVALLLGAGLLLGPKWGPGHRHWGRRYLLAGLGVVGTAALGLAVFNFRAYLLPVVVLTAYQGWSGWRVLHLRRARPGGADGAAAAATGLTALALLLARPSSAGWSLAVVLPTAGYLLALCLYDASRLLFGARWQQRSYWLPEHVWKMTGTYFGLVGAFTGTFWPHYKPYSQALPGITGTLVALGLTWYAARRRPVPRRLALGQAG